MTLLWFVSFIVLLFIELVTINLVTIWFALGALVSMIVSLFTDSFIIQIVVFIIVSIMSLIGTKAVVKRFKSFKTVPTNYDMVIGKKGIVTKKIENNKYGEVKIFGNTWTATSSCDIEIGTKVKVLSIEGVKLIVEKEEN